MSLRGGKVLEVILALTISAFTLYFIYRATTGKKEEYRRMPVLDAIGEGVDRSVETGRPIFMSMGAYAYLTGSFAAMTISGVNIMRYTFRMAVKKGAVPMFMLPINPEVAPLIDGVYRESCVAEGRPEAYRRENVFFFGNDEPAYRSGVLNLLATHRPSTYVIAGAITGTGDTIATWASRSMDVLVVGGNARITHQGISLAFDYPMYMTDVFAAGAILSDDELMKSTLISGDVMTWITVALMLVAIAAGLARLPISAWLKI